MKLLLPADTKQGDDIAASPTRGGIVSDFLRPKRYVKHDDETDAGGDPWSLTHPRTLEFDQPYQLASDRVGGTWTDNNEVACVQLHGCNLDCPYCFLGDLKNDPDAPTVEASGSDVLDAYLAAREAGEVWGRVLRISGGEPMLQQDGVLQVLSDRRLDPLAGEPETLVWIDTNLTRTPNDELLGRLSYPRVAVCGCFKPHLGASGLAEQAAFARQLIEAGVECFWYWPAPAPQLEGRSSFSVDSPNGDRCEYEGQVHEAYGAALDYGEAVAAWLFENVNRYAPLRTTLLYLKWHYAAMGLSKDEGRSRTDLSRVWCSYARRGFWQWCAEVYEPEVLWLPSHQIEHEMERS